MAVHKVPQDVEAEDKFLGPLTFKQFLFGGGVVITGYLMFLTITGGVAFLAIFILPFFLVFTALAFPWGKDQPTEIWLAARFRYLFFPRTRIWDQSGAKDLVTVTVPVREEHIYSDGLEQDEVRSRFNAIADVVDSRGWAIKNAALAATQQPAQQTTTHSPQTQKKQQSEDRLAPETTIQPPKKDVSSINKAHDVFDANSSQLPVQFDDLIKHSESIRRQATLRMVENALHPSNGGASTLTNAEGDGSEWFDTHKKGRIDPGLSKLKRNNDNKREVASTVDQGSIIMHDLEKEAVKTLKENKPAKNKKNARPAQQNRRKPSAMNKRTHSAASATHVDNSANAPSLPTVDPGILALAHNDDLNVETIARQAKKKTNEEQEVVIKLR